MNEQKKQPQLCGLIYGECTYWITLAGMCIAILGMLYYFFTDSQLLDVEKGVNSLWSGQKASQIWQTAAKEQFRWTLGNLRFGDGISMFGVGVCCFAGVIGAWGAWVGMLINKEKSLFFHIFAIIICLLLTCAACGLIYLH